MKAYSIFFCLLFSYALGHSQDLKIDYNASFSGLTSDEVNEIAKEKGMNKNQIKGFKYYISKTKADIESQQISLITNGDNSFELLLKSGLSSDLNQLPSMAPVALDLFDRLYSVEDKLIVGENQNDKFAVSFNSDVITWDIRDESKEILGFKCLKAVAKYKKVSKGQFARRTKEVWFAPSLNKRGGPIVYANLPGLILEVVNDNNTITAVSIKEVKSSKITPSKKLIYTENQYNKGAREAGEAIEKRMKN